LTDIQLGGVSGLELAAEARKLKPGIDIVILSDHSYFKYAHTAIRINVYDYLLKPVTSERVTECFNGLKPSLDARLKGGAK
jgi:two-component system response regulator YesN